MERHGKGDMRRKYRAWEGGTRRNSCGAWESNLCGRRDGVKKWSGGRGERGAAEGKNGTTEGKGGKEGNRGGNRGEFHTVMGCVNMIPRSHLCHGVDALAVKTEVAWVESAHLAARATAQTGTPLARFAPSSSRGVLARVEGAGPHACACPSRRYLPPSLPGSALARGRELPTLRLSKL
eukprot:165218-Rhodomonas_salina.1